MLSRSGTLSRIAVPILVTGFGVLVAQCAQDRLQTSSPGNISTPILLMGVILSAWHGGLGSGLLASVLSLTSLEYFFLRPIGVIDPGWDDLPRATVLVGVAVVVSQLTVRRRRAESALLRTDEKLRGAHHIQQRLYPAGVPMLPGIDIAGGSFPADTVGGDYFDYIPLAGGSTAVVVGDVSGHGLGPALLMAEIRAYLRALTLTHDDLEQILKLTNRILTEDTEEEFVTLFIAAVDPSRRSLTYAGAGHEAYLLEPDGDVRRLDSTGLPLGIDSDLPISTATPIRLVPGQVFLLPTDGLYETRSPAGEPFGIDRCFEVARTHRHRSAQEMIDAMHAELRRFTHNRSPEDDITLVVLKTLA